ncbi:Variant surface glycoprotein [Trypanosoma congolense IL3000]|uniref:Variant surface glycoprotein n=1 Tax=Trypanosoma congolense (strain IL3000) TaxID=1068625 RepID=F9WBQ3_TRYCI|nr:Variant surface glycoprotein [Trypanosoma congolense IL3000]
MMKLKCLIVVVMCLAVMQIVGAESGVAEGTKDHNKEAHHLLCDLMKAAVGKWGRSGETLSEPLKKALGRTIFGSMTGGSLEELRRELPDFYEAVLKGIADRSTACGGPESGQSAPYDMVCLCTLGNNSWPLDYIRTATTLCGQNKNDLGSEKGSKGWSDRGTGFEQITATWFNVIKHCLEGDKEKGEKLKEALEHFLGKLKNKPYQGNDRYQLGEGEPESYSACTGTKTTGVCVMYYNGTFVKKDRIPWWQDLQNALPEEEKFQEEKRRAEEEKRKQQEEAAKKEAKNTEDLKSGPQANNQTERSQKDKLHEAIRKYNMKSGTPKTSSMFMASHCRYFDLKEHH